MPHVASGWVSVGNGLAGLVSFPLWIGLNSMAFAGRTLISLWVVSLLGTGLCVASCAFYLAVRSDQRLERMLREKMLLAREFNREPTHLTSVQLVRKGWQSCATIFIVFYTSLLVYPDIAPLSWVNDSRYHINLLLGVFQLGDFVGRYIPLMETPYTLPGPATLLKWSAWRILLLGPVWIETQRTRGSFWYHCVLLLALSLTNGWLGTAAMIRGVRKFKSFRYQPYRDRFSSLMILCLLFAVCCGLWSSGVVHYGRIRL
eukprot:Protomagalhaensia_wolfi_Nauph_80__1721@NODE_206_length_3186_cov_32_849063_g155_i0_p1_GENE_NODE_206_length_3186_cov_32_849063_g155_i0NODE_206_length_3186_cov_32_849063_g155_i0_p1_ORF_typecomplete_len259_score8_60Nucleoside_tran/PF01733_18/3_6e26CLN3/PF02487_17/0_0068_NODE_206_length_3186_cov_32_849063_g155_i022993075